MALLSEIVATLRDLPRRGYGDSDDNRYTDRQLAFIVNYYRATLLKRDKDKGKYVTEYYVQDLGKVELIQSDPHGNCVVDKNIGCILRTKEKIPVPVDTNSQSLITFVGTLEGNQFQRTNYNKSKFGIYSKYSGRLTKWYQLDEYIYIVNPPTQALKYINIQGVFEDPIKANLFRQNGFNCEGENCYDEANFDFEYPMSLTLVDTIYKMYTSSEINTANMLPPEIVNDTSDKQG